MLFAFFAAACADGEAGPEDARQTCVGDGDCRSDHSCRNGVCQPNRSLQVRDTGGSEECLRPAECGQGFDCINNRCVASSGDVGRDSRTTDLGGAGDRGDDRSREQDEGRGPDEGTGTPDEGRGTPDEGTGTPDEGSGTPDEGFDECEGRDDGRYRETCDAASDCCNGMCLGSAEAGFGFCTQRCGSYDDCNPIGLPGDDFFCLDTAGSGYLCAPSDYGDACESTGECLGQVCLAGLGTTGCSWLCSFSADCPTGSACGAIAVSDGGDGFTFVQACSPVGNSCTIDRTGLNDCLSGTCLVPDVGSPYCSTFCNTGDPDPCPRGFVCASVEGSDPVCVRPGDL